MPNAHAPSIVRTALGVMHTHGHVPPLDLLDLAMVGHEGTSPDFEAAAEPFGDWTDPASPFGELLRRAFADDEIDAACVAVWLSEDPQHAAQQAHVAQHWQPLVIDRFAQRYDLWSR